MIGETVFGDRPSHVPYDAASCIFPPHEVLQRAISLESAADAALSDFAQHPNDFEKAAFAAVVRADQDGKVAKLHGNVAQALVILDVNALKHWRSLRQ